MHLVQGSLRRCEYGGHPSHSSAEALAGALESSSEGTPQVCHGCGSLSMRIAMRTVIGSSGGGTLLLQQCISGLGSLHVGQANQGDGRSGHSNSCLLLRRPEILHPSLHVQVAAHRVSLKGL